MGDTQIIHVKRSIELLYHLLDRADESCWLALEGDLSQFDDRGLTGVTRTVRGNAAYALSPPNNRVAVPLTPVNTLTLKLNILPRVGIRAQIRHVFLERDGRCLFAAYNRFQNGAQISEWATPDFLQELVEQGVIELELASEESTSTRSRSGSRKNYEPIYNLNQQNGSHSHGEYRHRPDHPGPVPEDNQQDRVG